METKPPKMPPAPINSPIVLYVGLVAKKVVIREMENDIIPHPWQVAKCFSPDVIVIKVEFTPAVSKIVGVRIKSTRR